MDHMRGTNGRGVMGHMRGANAIWEDVYPFCWSKDW